MSNKPHNPPAFACINNDGSMGQEGMTLRDYFAACALQGELASQDGGGKDYKGSDAPMVAKFAYALADAMLAARDDSK